MPIIALLILIGFWLLGTVVAVAVCRAAAQGDDMDAGDVRRAPAIARPSRRFSGAEASRT